MPYSSRAFQWYQEHNKGKCGLGDLLNRQTKKQRNKKTNYLPSLNRFITRTCVIVPSWNPKIYNLGFC